MRPEMRCTESRHCETNAPGPGDDKARAPEASKPRRSSRVAHRHSCGAAVRTRAAGADTRYAHDEIRGCGMRLTYAARIVRNGYTGDTTDETPREPSASPRGSA